MPTKHIPDLVWREVEKEMVKAVVATQKPIKESQILEMLLKKGLDTIEEEDYLKAMKKKNIN